MNRFVAAVPVMLGLSLGAGSAFSQAKVSDGILTDLGGKTLYTFDKDAAGKSACTGPCEKLWPPVIASSSSAASRGSSATTSSEYSVIKRDGGTMQWAYKGKPLYMFRRDQKPGDKSGDGFANNAWHVAKP